MLRLQLKYEREKLKQFRHKGQFFKSKNNTLEFGQIHYQHGKTIKNVQTCQVKTINRKDEEGCLV